MVDDEDDSGVATVTTAVEATIQRGFLHIHTQLSRGDAWSFRTAARTWALVDLLVAKGFLSEAEVQRAVARAEDGLLATDLGTGLGVALHDDTRDKYDHPDVVEIDCASRVSACRAACCSLDVPLSAQDIGEGRARWDLARPYFLLRRGDGRCSHLQGQACGIHASRPLSCRTFTCRDDPRIWHDFDAGIANVEGIEALLARRTVTLAPEPSP